VGFVACVALVAACRAPTQWTLIVHNEVPCDVKPQVFLYTAPTRAELGNAEPTSRASTCGGGTDDIVLVPRNKGSDTFIVRLVTRIDGQDPTACVGDARPTGKCIEQSWQLSFRAHESQTLETTLSLACVDVKCPSDQTCVRNGECVPTAVGTCPNNDCSFSAPFDAGPPRDSGPEVDSDVAPPPPVGPSTIATGPTSCVRYYDGRAWCWGRNENGQLGWGDLLPRGDAPSTIPSKLPAIGLDFGGTLVKIVGTFGKRTCVVLDAGRLRCWGANENGILGYGDTKDRGGDSTTMPGKLADLTFPTAGSPNLAVTAIAMGDAHTCVLLEDGTMRCWGRNEVGQLGYGDTVARSDTAAVVPVPLGTGKITQIAAGQSHTCALFEDGTLKCWGANAFGQLGLGDTADRGTAAATTPDKLPAVFGATDVRPKMVAAGGNSTCVVLRDGNAKCWGQDNFSRLGYGAPSKDRGGDATSKPPSLPLIDFNDSSPRKATFVAMGQDHTCLLFDNAKMKCWGANESGQSGDSLLPDLSGFAGPTSRFVELGVGRTALSIAASGADTCAILDDESVKCWGHNAFGQLGLGDMNARKFPDTAPISLPK